MNYHRQSLSHHSETKMALFYDCTNPQRTTKYGARMKSNIFSIITERKLTNNKEEESKRME